MIKPFEKFAPMHDIELQQLYENTTSTAELDRIAFALEVNAVRRELTALSPATVASLEKQQDRFKLSPTYRRLEQELAANIHATISLGNELASSHGSRAFLRYGLTAVSGMVGIGLGIIIATQGKGVAGWPIAIATLMSTVGLGLWGNSFSLKERRVRSDYRIRLDSLEPKLIYLNEAADKIIPKSAAEIQQQATTPATWRWAAPLASTLRTTP